MAITTEDVKKLRDQTGISVMQCKKALEEAGGDFEKAVIILQKQSKAAASKKADRVLKAGRAESYIHGNGRVGSMIVLSCETDFVAQNAEFKELAKNIAMQVAAMSPEFVKPEDVSEEARVKAKEVFAEEVKGKPADLQEKILAGKLDAYFKDKVLLSQAYIKDPEKTIQNLIEEAIQKIGERIEVTEMVRFEV